MNTEIWASIATAVATLVLFIVPVTRSSDCYTTERAA